MKLRKQITALLPLTLALLLLTGVIDVPAVNAATGGVVISEFRTRGPAGDSDEFVELYNSSSSPISIANWTLRGSNNAGVTTILATVPSNIVIPSGCHYLFTNSTAGTGYSGSVVGDIGFTSGITDDGGIAVYNGPKPYGSRVDAAGMSSGSAFREGTPLTPLTSNTDESYERKPGGALGNGQDTQDNATDFSLSQPSNPQNLASPCIGAGITASGSANPSAVNIGGSVLFTVTVLPNTTSGATVTADLSSIGGSPNTVFYDDGTNGDGTAGDRVFSLSYTLPAGAPLGGNSITATANDGAGHTATVTISFVVNPPQYTIMQIQGSGARSPLEGQTLQTTGVVYDVAANGFWMQDPNGDNDPATSDGIFVSTPFASQVHIGDLVDVSGFVAEVAPSGDPSAAPETQVINPGMTVLSSGNPLPVPVTISAADLDPNGSFDQLEHLEGMRVHIDTLNVVAPTGGVIDETNAVATSNGVFYGVIPALPRPFRGSGIELPGTAPTGSPCCIPSWNGAPQRLRVDTTTLSSALDVTTGAVVSGLTGPLAFQQHSYTIVTETTPALVSGNLAAVPVPAPSTSEFTVGSFEMQRFYDATVDPAVSDVVLTQAAFNNRLNKASLAIRNVMMTPDVIGVQEVENLATLQALADKVNNDAVTAGAPNPGYTPYLMSGNDSSGLNVGFLVASRVTVSSVNQFGLSDTFVQPDGTSALINDHPPLVLNASVTNEGLTSSFVVIVAHQLALNGIDGPNGSLIRAKRHAQAEYLANLVQSFQSSDPSSKIVVLGNFNAFSANDGYVDVMGTVEGNPTSADQVVLASSDLVDPNFTDLETTISADQRYSYVNLGSAEALDHVLVSQGMMPIVTGFAYARNGADYPEVYRTNQSRPERVSDHDMPVAYFSLPLDTTPPVLTLPADITTEATSSMGAVVTFNATANDANQGPTSVDCNPASGGTFGLGTTTVSCTSQDTYNNVASGSFHVTVNDTTPPTMSLPADITASATSAAGAVVTYTATATDLVDGPTAVICNPASGSTFPLGTMAVSCSSKDAHNNTASGSFNVTVADTTAPVLSLPADITASATSAAGAVVTFSSTATDAVDGPTVVTCSPASGSTFALGTTAVSCSSKDAHNNLATGAFNVTVVDTTAPVLTLPADIMASATSAAGAVVSFTATATDAVDGPTTVTCLPAPGSTFPPGTTIVSCSSKDAHNNVASGLFHVTVTDNTPPVLTLPADITVSATNSSGAVVTFSATATDAVDGPTTINCAPASGATFGVGTTTVSCSSKDSHNNVASGSFRVTVTPSISVAPVVAVTGVTDGGRYKLGAVPVAGCNTVAGSAPIAVSATLSLTGGNTSGVGLFTATCSGARDVNGLVAPPVSASYSVTYVWSGFLFLDTTIFQSGSSIPLAWTLSNAQGKLAGNASSFVSLQYAANLDCSGASEGAPMPADTPGNSGLVYFAGLFTINWKTTGLPAGCYSILLGLDDGTTRSTIVQLKSNDDTSIARPNRGSRDGNRISEGTGHYSDDHHAERQQKPEKHGRSSRRD